MDHGLALSGGSARGLAHIGVLEVLEANRVPPAMVAGTSMGAIVGGLYCLAGTSRDLRTQAQQLLQSESFRQLGLAAFYDTDNNVLRRFKREIFEKIYLGALLFRTSHVRQQDTDKLFRALFGDARFEDCRVPFACNALNIETGEEEVFSRGLLADAVRASCAIPGIFPPAATEGKILVDGGVTHNIPITPLRRLGARCLVAVYLGERPEFEGAPETGFRITQRAQAFVKYHLDQLLLGEADVVITPDVAAYHWADFAAAETLIASGRTAAANGIAAIRATQTLGSRLRRWLRGRP